MSEIKPINRQSKLVFCFSADTGEFTGAVFAQENPRRPGNFLMPANSTEVEPPERGVHEIQVWDGEKWEVKPDFRDCEVFECDNPLPEGFVMNWIGPLPEGHTILNPWKFKKPRWNGTEWEEDEVAVWEAEVSYRKNLIREAYRDDLEAPVETSYGTFNGGFDSAGLLDQAARKAEKRGRSTVILTDSANIPHEFTIAEVEEIALDIGDVAEEKFLRKQSKMVEIDAVPQGDYAAIALITY